MPSFPLYYTWRNYLRLYDLMISSYDLSNNNSNNNNNNSNNNNSNNNNNNNSNNNSNNNNNIHLLKHFYLFETLRF